jgi:hypothetical protein
MSGTDAPGMKIGHAIVALSFQGLQDFLGEPI